jgi:hypothetical protein
MAIEKIKRYKLPHTDQITAEEIQASGRTLHSEIHTIINSISHLEELPQ